MYLYTHDYVLVYELLCVRGKTEGESADFDTFFGGIVVNSVKL